MNIKPNHYRGLILAFSLLASLVCNTMAGIQTSQQSNSREVFNKFFEPMLGDWQCTIQEWSDPAKPPVWEDRQLRRFERVLHNGFLQEWAYVSAKGSTVPTAAGMHLTSYDPKSGKVYQSGYWAQTAGRLFELEGNFDKSGKRIEGVMTIRIDGGPVEKRRVEIEWVGQSKHVYRVFKRLPNGTEFLHEELVYTRKSA